MILQNEQSLGFIDFLMGFGNCNCLCEKVIQFVVECVDDLVFFMFGVVNFDGFCLINDFFGCDVGDEIFCQVVYWLSVCMLSGVIVIWYGSDEFVFVLLFVFECYGVEWIGVMFKEVFFVFYDLGDCYVWLFVFFGFVIYFFVGEDFFDFLKSVEMVFYCLKCKGMGSVIVYLSEIVDEMWCFIQIEQVLCNVIIVDEVDVYFQLIVNFVGDEVVGFEVLV